MRNARSTLGAARTLAFASLASLALSGFAGAGPARAGDLAEGPPVKVPLAKASFKKGRLRAGFDLAVAELPLAGFQAKVAGQTIFLFDLDGDGALAPETDGLALPAASFVVPLPEVLLLESGQYRVAFEGTKALVLRAQDLGPVAGHVRAAAVVTEVRVRAGVRPAAISVAASDACAKHLDYLKLNGLTDGSGGMTVHDEDPARPGYTPEGELAAGRSCLAFHDGDLRAAILAWYATTWHGEPIIRSTLEAFGVALKHGVAMYYTSAEGARGDRNGDPDRIQLHPPDGAVSIPTAYGQFGEQPNPVPGTQSGRGCGIPIYAALTGEYRDHALASATVVDPAGRPVAGTLSCPKKVANPEWPTNSGCALFIPSRPLAGGATYRVRFEFEGGLPPLVWSFMTAGR